MRIIHAAMAATAALFLSGSALATELPSPTGEIILKVTGMISNTNIPDGAVFDFAMLEGLRSRVTTTNTPWHDGAQTFEGPLLSAIAGAVGATGSTWKFTAVNDYSADIPTADIDGHLVILATRRNGEPMSLRDKGPLFVIYPFDEHPALYSERYFNRSVWQVNSIAIE